MRTAALLVVELVVLALLLETGLRVVRPDLDVPHLRVHAAGYYTWYPGSQFTYRNLPEVDPPSASVRINAVGLRGPDVPATKAANERRVLVLGDSYTAGVQLPEDEIFPTVLERELRTARPATTYRVLNTGVNGAATGEEVLYFEHEGAALAPDVVVLQYSWNDVADTRARGVFQLVDGVAELRPDLRDPAWWREPLLAFRDAIGNRSLAAYLVYRFATGTVAHAEDLGPSEDPAVTTVIRLAERLLRDANARGMPVVLLTIPMPTAVGGGYADYDAVVAAFRTLVAKGTNQLVVADRPLRDARTRGDNPYLLHDGHLSPAGHRAVAGALAPAVLRYDSGA